MFWSLISLNAFLVTFTSNFSNILITLTWTIKEYKRLLETSKKDECQNLARQLRLFTFHLTILDCVPWGTWQRTPLGFVVSLLRTLTGPGAEWAPQFCQGKPWGACSAYLLRLPSFAAGLVALQNVLDIRLTEIKRVWCVSCLELC